MMQVIEFPFMWSSLLVLFFGGLFIYILRGRLHSSVGGVAVLISTLSALLMVPPFYRVLVERGTAYEGFRWSTVLGEFGLNLDGISLPITFAVVILGLLSVVYAVGYTEHEHSRPTFFANQLFFVMGMQWVTLATNLVEFFMAWELMLVPSYFLILFWGLPETRQRTALKFWLYTQSGAVAILVGIALLYFVSGATSFELAVIQAAYDSFAGAEQMLKLIFVLFAAGFLVKMAVFPLHWWLPPVHAEAPTPISVLLSGAMIETGAYALVRLGTVLLPETARAMALILCVLGVLTMFYGGVMALAQTDIKRLLAYSSVSQMGYVLFALGSFATFGVTGGLFHLINHAFSKGLLFMTAGAVIHQTHLRDITKMGGLSKKMPMTAFTAAVGAMSIAGSPPLSGFASEWMMFTGGLQRASITTAGVGQPVFLWLSIIAVTTTIISAAYMLRFLGRVFLGPTRDELAEVAEAPRSMTVPMIILGFLIVLFGVLPGLALDVVSPAIAAIRNIIP